MTELQKYKLFIGLAIGLFLYIGATEVYDRWNSAFSAYYGLVQKQSSLLTPEELAEKQGQLIVKKKTLFAQAVRGSSKYSQNQTGIFEYLADCGSSQGIRYSALNPAESKAQGEMQEIGFKADFTADYVTTGKWVNAIESGYVSVAFAKLELSTENALTSKLKVHAAGSAFIFPNAAGHEDK